MMQTDLQKIHSRLRQVSYSLSGLADLCSSSSNLDADEVLPNIGMLLTSLQEGMERDLEALEKSIK